MTTTDLGCATSRRGRANRAKGATYERQVSAWLRQNGWPHAERAIRNGWRTDIHVSEDPYDITGTPGLLWSLKNADASEDQAARWLLEVHDEATRRGLTGVLVWKRRGNADIGRSWAYRIVELAGLTVPARTLLADAVAVLHAEGYGDVPDTGL